MPAPWDVILWWEVRRIPFNLLVGATGLGGIALAFWIGDVVLPPGEDAIEPMLLFLGIPAYGAAANACYTLGWASEVLWCKRGASHSDALRRRLFRMGLAFSVAVTALPFALLLAFWAVLGVR